MLKYDLVLREEARVNALRASSFKWFHVHLSWWRSKRPNEKHRFALVSAGYRETSTFTVIRTKLSKIHLIPHRPVHFSHFCSGVIVLYLQTTYPCAPLPCFFLFFSKKKLLAVITNFPCNENSLSSDFTCFRSCIINTLNKQLSYITLFLSLTFLLARFSRAVR